jgi:signal transduction histidine kinase/ActR/RegA family two-component response regulator/HAMP domain-containing protein
MQRFSIARSLRLALIGLTLVLALVAALGVASLYSTRQHYEDALNQSSALSVAAAGLPAAWLDAPSAYAAAVRNARRFAAADKESAQLVASEVAAETRARTLVTKGGLTEAVRPGGPLAQARLLSARVGARQQTRQATARSKARSDSRRAVIVVAIAGALALAAALLLVAALVGAMRRPLDELVRATRDLAAGKLDRRVNAGGPRELIELGQAFNAMAEDLALANKRLQDEGRRLAVTIESLGDGLIVTEPDSVTVRAINPRAAELVPELGPSARTDQSPLPPLEAALSAETVVEHDGRTLAVVASRLGTGEDGVVWTVRDITDRARLERAKSEFVATASHELRSPLTSIKGFVELLARSPEGMSERQREFIDIILRSTDRLVELVNDLLDVARIDADKVELERRPTDVGQAIREVTELLATRVAEKQQRMEVRVAAALPPAMADPGRLRQIIANLLTNAHQYTPEGGRLEVGAETDQDQILISVSDSGLGMTAEQVERAFDRFYRASSSGTGLGLSIVKSLVELHKGQIEVDSQPGQGTTFRVRLPAAVQRPESSQALDVLRGRRVLVVDDEPEVTALIADQLATVDVDVQVAMSGEEALAALRSGSFDAVTLDILMPGMDGFEVLRTVRADPELRGTPIVFVSVFSSRRELAGEWVVSKPIDADELRRVLGAAVAAERSRVLVVARSELHEVLEPSLEALGVEHDWELSAAAAARVCAERHFEVALVDVGMRSPRAVLEALDLRGRRLRRAVILFSDGAAPTPPGISELGMEVVPVEQVAAALTATLRSDDVRVAASEH